MASRKVYFTKNPGDAELEAFRDKEGRLFVSLTDTDDEGHPLYILLNKEDAYELIEELATQFGWLDKTKNEQGVRTWNEEYE